MTTSKGNILIVEDERLIALELKHSLEDRGFRCAGFASNADQALELARRLRPDLVLMDIRLEGQGDGIGAAKILQQELGLPVIFLTSHSDETTVRRAAELGPYGYLLKPIEEHELTLALEMALSKARMETALRRQERWLATTLRSIREAVVCADNTGKVTFLNPAASNLLGWQGDEAKGEPLGKILELIDETTGRKHEPFVEVFAAPTNPEVRLCTHLSLLTRDGRRLHVSESIAPITDEDGTLLGTLVILRDVSAEVRTERDFFAQQFERMLAHLSELEINGKVLFAEVLGALGPDQKVLAGTVVEACRDLRFLTSRLAAVHQSSTEETPAPRTAVQLQTLLRELPEVFRGPTTRKKIVLALDLPQQPITVSAERELLWFLIASLVETLLENSPPVSTVRISLAVEQGEGPRLELSNPELRMTLPSSLEERPPSEEVCAFLLTPQQARFHHFLSTIARRHGLTFEVRDHAGIILNVPASMILTP
ncbi:MAG: hypothetical protein A2284_00010 [Deltaproteobacteria bacterium RIFOXYA12_FULL_61_11]|nr:MAG: hypothetical protein A2284_00010 [Deltaproteobacteria bacterium RIFOXYA12_FULL_61_11]